MKVEIDKLPKKQKMALMLRVFEGLNFKEIAEIMGSPYDTAKANYRHAVLRLKDFIEKDEVYFDWKDLKPRGRYIDEAM